MRKLKRPGMLTNDEIAHRAIRLLERRRYTRDYLALSPLGLPVSPSEAYQQPRVALSLRGAIIAAAGSSLKAAGLIDHLAVKPTVESLHNREPSTKAVAIRILQDYLQASDDPTKSKMELAV